jgi:hypothetical protein
MNIKAALKSRQSKRITTAIILLANALLWIIPSNVAYLTAQNRDVLLGRYSLGHLTALFLLIPISAAMLYLTWSNERNEKERRFKVIAISLCVLVSLIVMDIVARLVLPKRYVAEQTYFHRPPNDVQAGTAKDVPEEAFLYPRTPPGYPDIEYTLTTDKRGFRNKTDLERYDVVVLGDSFAEGSHVTDDDVWPALLAQESNLTVYNIGMSSGHPGTYLETLKKFGPELSPKTVVCLLFEGNDFRDENFKEKNSISDQLEEHFKTSPLRNTLKTLLIRCFASKAPKPPVRSADDPRNAATWVETTGKTLAAISWLPVSVPEGPNGKYYTFTVKRLLEHFVTNRQFIGEKGVKKTFAALKEIKKICAEKDVRLIIAYAPDKPHVLLPLITRTVSPEQLRAFMALKGKKLPPADKLLDVLLPRLDVQESAVRDFCSTESIEFISLAEPLRRTIAEGAQAYFTYDEHWTPLGHQIVAETISQYLWTTGGFLTPAPL